MHLFARVILAATVLLLSTVVASAQGDQKAGPKPPSPYEKIWTKFTDWYNDKENPVVQRVLFTGRFQEDYAASKPTRAATANGTSAGCASGRASRCSAITWCTPKSN